MKLLGISTLLFVACLSSLTYSQSREGKGNKDPFASAFGGADQVPQEIISYQRASGPSPNWLDNGLASVNARESLRGRLNNLVTIESAQKSASDLMATLRENGIEVEFDRSRLDNEGIDIESSLGLPSGEGPLRELLMRTLDQQGLAYRVFDHHIQITTKSAASDYPDIRYYDMAYVQPNNKLTREIILAIENSIDPDHWANNGGTGSLFSVGQLLIVRTTENYHLEIERMLARLSQVTTPESPKVNNSTMNHPFGT